ncbi:13460_t:CDS:1, partial [Acaulospora colombiana]
DAGEALDESVAFTPTVLAHRARESATSSPGSAGAGLAIRNAKPPPSSTRHLRTISFPAVGGETSSPAVHERGESASGYASDIVGPAMGNSPRYTQGRPDPLVFATPGSVGRAGQLHSGRESLDMQRPTERASPGTSTSPPSNAPRGQSGASPRADGTRRPS